MGELDRLVDEAWEADAATVKTLWKAARRLPELSRSAWTLEWVRKKRYEEAGAGSQNLLEAAALALAAEGDPRIVPFLVPRAFERWDFGRLLLAWLETERVDGARLARAVRPFVHGEGAGVHGWILAARCLARFGDAGDREILASRLGECFDAMWSRDPSRTVRMEAHASRLAGALLQLGVPRSAVPMLEGVVTAEPAVIDRARGAAALLLASLGTGLDAIARGLRDQLDRGDGQRVVSGQLLALGALGKVAPSEARRALAALVRRVVNASGERAETSVTVVAAEAALADLGEPSDLLGKARDCLARTRYGWDETVRTWVSILDLVGSRRDLPVELATPFVREEDLRLHRAARRALRERGAPVPEVRLADPWWVAHASPLALREALVDERTLSRTVVARQLGASPDREATPALLAALAALPGARHDSDPRRHAKRAIHGALLAAGAPEGLVLVARAIESDEQLVDVDDLPVSLAPTVVRLHVRAESPRVREGARRWISARLEEPEVARALEAVGFTVDDFAGRGS